MKTVDITPIKEIDIQYYRELEQENKDVLVGF